MSRPMRIAHYSGTAPNATDPTKIVLGKQAQYINIRNTDAANALEVSFDGGRNYYKLPINSFPLMMNCSLLYFHVRGVGGAAAWCAVTNEG